MSVSSSASCSVCSRFKPLTKTVRMLLTQKVQGSSLNTVDEAVNVHLTLFFSLKQIFFFPCFLNVERKKPGDVQWCVDECVSALLISETGERVCVILISRPSHQRIMCLMFLNHQTRRLTPHCWALNPLSHSFTSRLLAPSLPLRASQSQVA